MYFSPGFNFYTRYADVVIVVKKYTRKILNTITKLAFVFLLGARELLRRGTYMVIVRDD